MISLMLMLMMILIYPDNYVCYSVIRFGYLHTHIIIGLYPQISLLDFSFFSHSYLSLLFIAIFHWWQFSFSFLFSPMFRLKNLSLFRNKQFSVIHKHKSKQTHYINPSKRINKKKFRNCRSRKKQNFYDDVYKQIFSFCFDY